MLLSIFSRAKWFFFILFLCVLSDVKSAAPDLNYSINLMWINRVLNDGQLYIHPSSDENDLDKNFLGHVFKWAEVSSGKVVNVWFDGVLTPAKAVENTAALIKKYTDKHLEGAKIRLRDVREIPLVQKHTAVFSDKIPVYFRVDLLRPIIALHMLLSTHEIDYFVYGDLDMEPLSPEQLFDDETVQNLNKYGIVMAYMLTSYENGFQIISNDNRHLLEALEWALIQVNIQRVYNAVQSSSKLDPQVVFSSYELMFEYFYHLEGYGTLRAWTGIGENYEDYDKSKDSELKMLGSKLFTSVDLDRLSTKFVSEECYDDRTRQFLVPTKRVDLPQTRRAWD